MKSIKDWYKFIYVNEEDVYKTIYRTYDVIDRIIPIYYYDNLNKKYEIKCKNQKFKFVKINKKQDLTT